MKKFNVTVNGKSYAVEVEEVGTGQGGFTYAPVQQAASPAPQTAPVPQVSTNVTPLSPKETKGPSRGELMTAPMPGTILDIKVKEGEAVKEGDLILILEAMKMENEIVSPKDGVVNKIHITKSTVVSTGDPLVTIE